MCQLAGGACRSHFAFNPVRAQERSDSSSLLLLQVLQDQLAEVRAAGEAAATHLAQTAAALAERQAAVQQADEQRLALEAQVRCQGTGMPQMDFACCSGIRVMHAQARWDASAQDLQPQLLVRGRHAPLRGLTALRMLHYHCVQAQTPWCYGSLWNEDPCGGLFNLRCPLPRRLPSTPQLTSWH